MARTYNSDHLICPTETALGIIGGKWKGMILWCLAQRTMRFSELHRTIPNITQRMLIKQLRDLEDCEIIERKVYPEVPPKVEYYLSAHGERLTPILDSLEEWSRTYLAGKISAS